MTGAANDNTASATPDPLPDHCRALGLAIWRIDERGNLVAQPSGWGPVEPWLRSRGLVERICSTVTAWPPLPDATELFPGCWLLPIARNEGPYRPCYTVAVALGTQILVAEEVEAICREEGIDPELAKEDLVSLARFRPCEMVQLTATLRWMHDALDGAASHATALSSFSLELAHAYEQISMLYKLGRSMNWLTRPDDFVSTACNLLLEMFDFAWIAVKYAAVKPAPPQLAGKLVVTGTLPCPRQEFDGQVGAMLQRATGDHWHTLLEPRDDELAARVGSQVVVEHVMSAGGVAALLMAGGKTGDDHEVTSIETQMLDATAEYLGAFLHNVGLYAEQREMFIGTIRALSAAIDAKDRYTQGHSERVALMGSRLAAALGMSDEQVERVRIAGLVHDVGKIGVPEAVLCKPGRLTDEEFAQIKRHPVIGHTILQDIGPLAEMLPGVLYHHERWDGRGYPEGLGGADIPRLGRLLAVADAFDAMSSNRSYRSALPREKVLREIAECAGTQFDPELAKIFVTLDLSEYDAMVARHEAAEAEAA